MTEYDATLTVRDINGNPLDLPTLDGHQSTCQRDEGRHAPGCVHASDCRPGSNPPTPSGLGCGCGLPNWPRVVTEEAANG